MAAPACIREYQELAARTTIGTGGTARYFAVARCLGDLMRAACFAREHGLPLFVLGRGSNVIAADGVVGAVVAVLGGAFREMSIDAGSAEVRAGAGVSLIKLGVALARQGYPGCAFMGVIPGSVGGAVRMNAGIPPGQDIASRLLRARVFDPQRLAERWLCRDDLRFSCRHSMLADSPLIVLEAVFALPEKRDPAPGQSLAAIKSLFARRRTAQPTSRFTFGSTFKNPAGAEHAAGWYLEQAGMKGARCGGAMVAREHANWIVNTGGARSSDVKALIEQGRTRVHEIFGIALEREVVYLPEDMAGLRQPAC